MNRLARWVSTVPLRLRSLLQCKTVEQELDDEFQFHLQHQIEEYTAQGMDAEEARYAALRTLGGVQHTRTSAAMRAVSDSLMV